MKNYKDYNKTYIGSSDSARLTLKQSPVQQKNFILEKMAATVPM